MRIRHAVLAASCAVAALTALGAPAVAGAARAQARYEITPVGRGQPDCLVSQHALGRSRGLVLSTRRGYKVSFLIYIERLPATKVNVYVTSVSGDGYGGNSDYGGNGACPVKRIRLATLRVHHHSVLVSASTSWLPSDAAVYVSVKPARHPDVPWSYATSSVFVP